MIDWRRIISRNGDARRKRRQIPELVWTNDEHLRVGDTEFILKTDIDALHRIQTTKERFLLGKNRSMVEDSGEMRDAVNIKNIVDIGIFKGGSTALYTLLFQPKKLVAIEYLESRIESLDEFIRTRGLSDKIKLYYGTDQSNSAMITQIVKREFEGDKIDLVVDDASHYYPQTRASFQVLFPELRPGGLYIIEEWGWAHWSGEIWQKSQAFAADVPSLTNLLIEIAMLSASRPDLVSRLEVQHSVIKVTRGPAPMGLGELRLDKECLNRGREFSPWM